MNLLALQLMLYLVLY